MNRHRGLPLPDADPSAGCCSLAERDASGSAGQRDVPRRGHVDDEPCLAGLGARALDTAPTGGRIDRADQPSPTGGSLPVLIELTGDPDRVLTVVYELG
ncbi:hypothetical protein HNP84_005301 [Thermocatellispora tengchongensis]|uniref:Uncharacterized protein n=1 Tax=Thermocatellispora tengchongensis TaxID=1073253 RepID=A0A840PEI1_9ACTN|nr:hypothetical protein [Thermocatellispora tengchongensis]MBB5135557.1 hypothetical protein [Thermocatellispora tengchongensis]